MGEAKTRKVHTPKFKAEVGLEGAREVKTINLKNSVGGKKSRSCFDRLSTNGIFSDHPTGAVSYTHLTLPTSDLV